MIAVEEYTDTNGRNRFDEWRTSLDPTNRRRVATAIDRLRAGNTSSLKALGDGLQEIRLSFGPGYRVYLGQQSGIWYLLLAGGDKSKQSRDIELARKLWQEAKE